MKRIVVIDTNIFVGALMRRDGVNRAVLEQCFRGIVEPLMGDALFYEYEDLLHRDYLFSNSSFTAAERLSLFDDFCGACRWVAVHYRWRPNLEDEGDNHILELAMAGNAQRIVSWNARDFRERDMLLPDVAVVTPVEFLQDIRRGRT
jgi:putative PIN family toxin of toxin-antitoxin system